MQNDCTHGFKLLVTDVKKAIHNAMLSTLEKRQIEFEKRVKEKQKGFFRTRTEEEAIKVVLYDLRDRMEHFDFFSLGWGHLEWAIEMESALKLHQDNEYVWLSKDDASMVSSWAGYISKRTENDAPIHAEVIAMTFKGLQIPKDFA